MWRFSLVCLDGTSSPLHPGSGSDSDRNEPPAANTPVSEAPPMKRDASWILITQPYVRFADWLKADVVKLTSQSNYHNATKLLNIN